MNKPYSVFLVDDETKSCDILTALLNKNFNHLHIAGKAHSVDEAYPAILKAKPDLVFLDVEMPYGNGFDLLQKFNGKIDFQVIFVTAYDQYAIKAIRFSALDYLLKPVNEDELIIAVNKYIALTSANYQTESLTLLLAQLQKPEHLKRIAIPSSKGLIMLNLSDIIYLQAEGSYTKIHTSVSNNNTITIPHTLKEYEDMLDDSGFFRVHHSALINLQHVSSYIKGRGGQVVMSNNDVIEVAQRKREELIQLLLKMS